MEKLEAYLHLANADYWYQRARRKRPPLSLSDEFKQLVEEYF
ncbi:MAG: hypothetical protein NVV59_19055 [Chitinophagaceae bacterium]|nr:hypothetical protein [Chitinophagaceae bacterium]